MSPHIDSGEGGESCAHGYPQFGPGASALHTQAHVAAIITVHEVHPAIGAHVPEQDAPALQAGVVSREPPPQVTVPPGAAGAYPELQV